MLVKQHFWALLEVISAQANATGRVRAPNLLNCGARSTSWRTAPAPGVVTEAGTVAPQYPARQRHTRRSPLRSRYKSHPPKEPSSRRDDGGTTLNQDSYSECKASC